MKCFIVTDVHSFYDEMMLALDKKGFDKDNPNHVFISLGDLLDRGTMIIEPSTDVYEGMIVGIHNRENDLNVNPCKNKEFSNLFFL